MIVTVLGAAAPDPSGGYGSLVLVLAALAALYLVASLVWPYAPCRVCGGKGRSSSLTGRSWRNCGRCGGTGRRIRLGKRLFSR